MKFSSIITLSALFIGTSSAFTVVSTAPRTTALASAIAEQDQLYFVDDAATDSKVPPSLVVSEEQQIEKPKPVKKAPKKPKKPSGGHGEGGLFSPVVKLAKNVIGEERLNKVRGKAIGLHSDVIRDFVETSDSEFGQTALNTLFRMADADKNGRIDEAELRRAMKFIGFTHLNEKQISGIFARADKDGDGTLDLDEFKAEAPKTLKTNLIKMAKTNGGQLGFLA